MFKNFLAHSDPRALLVMAICLASVVVLVVFSGFVTLYEAWRKRGSPSFGACACASLSLLQLTLDPRSARGAYYRSISLSPASLSARFISAHLAQIPFKSPLTLYAVALFAAIFLTCAFSPFFDESRDHIAIPLSHAYHGASPAARIAIFLHGSIADRVDFPYDKKLATFSYAPQWKDALYTASSHKDAYFVIERDAFESARLNAHLRLLLPSRNAIVTQSTSISIDDIPDVIDKTPNDPLIFNPALFLAQADLSRPFEWSLLSASAAFANPLSPGFLSAQRAANLGFSQSKTLATSALGQAQAHYAQSALRKAFDRSREDLCICLLTLVSVALLIFIRLLIKALIALPMALSERLKSPAQLARWEAAVFTDAKLAAKSFQPRPNKRL